MSKHYTMRPRRMKVEFRESTKATAHGGQFGVMGVAEAFGLWKRVQEDDRLDPRKHKGKGYDPHVYVAALLHSFTSGGDSLADAERLGEDRALCELLGLKKVPDQSAVGEWLRNIGAPGCEALRELLREFVAWALERAEADRLLHGGELECFFDDTQLEVGGKCFEGATLNYNGDVALSWQTLWVGPFVADGVIGPPADHKLPESSAASGRDVSAWLPELVAANASLWEDSRSYLYADSASSAGAYLETINGSFDRWSVSYTKWRGPLETRAAELDDGFWSEEELKTFKNGREQISQYASFRYQPEGCAEPQLFCVVRYKNRDEFLWAYRFIVVDQADERVDPQARFERHRLKGEYERRFGEVLIDLGLHHPPCQSLNANNAYSLMGLLAHNVLQAIKLIWMPPEQQWMRNATLIKRLWLIPVEIKRHARSLKALCFVPGCWVAWWSRFVEELLPQCHVVGG